MQDEVNTKVVAIMIKGGKISAEVLKKALDKFVQEIEKAQKQKQEAAQQKDFEMNADTSGLTVAGHIGTWHTIDRHEVSGHSFYLMEHDTYGDEAACIIVDERGKLVLDDVYNGFDDDTLRLLDLEVKEVPEMPDSTLSVQDMTLVLFYAIIFTMATDNTVNGV